MIEKMKKIKWMKVVEVAAVVGFMFSLSIMSCYADTNPGIKFGQWIQTNVVGLFGAIIACLGLFFLITRKIVKGLGFMIVGGLAAILVFSGSEFSKIIGDQVMSFFK